jgi:phage/plasmid-like protein (TIGR03299 family)
MVAAVEVFENGEAAFASLREPAWHGLGTVFSEPVSTDEMLRLAHMDNWNVRLEEVNFGAGYVSQRPYFATVRDNPATAGQKDVLGVVRERYKTFQNEQLFAFADGLLAEGRWETAGSIKNGSVVFGSLALERETVLDPTGVADVVKSYLMVSSSHDGSAAIQGTITPVRVVCQNTLNIALANAKQTYKSRHTQKAEDRLKFAAEALGMGHKYLDAFEVEAQALYAAEINNIQFLEIISAAYPKPDEDVKGSMTKWENKVDAIFEIWNGPTEVGIKGTAWGALNAMTERLDWGRTSRGGNEENIFAAASGFDAAMNAEKNRLTSIVKELVFA